MYSIEHKCFDISYLILHLVISGSVYCLVKRPLFLFSTRRTRHVCSDLLPNETNERRNNCCCSRHRVIYPIILH